MGQHFTLGAGPVQIMGQHVLPRLYGCRRHRRPPFYKPLNCYIFAIFSPIWPNLAQWCVIAYGYWVLQTAGLKIAVWRIVIAIPSHFESSGISELFVKFPEIPEFSRNFFVLNYFVSKCRRPAKGRRFCPTRCPSRFLQMWCLNSLTTCQWIRWKTV